ncbi:MAG TPA: DUF4126 domain-containing protein [Ktedonobacteraceae bacterium]|nr:DUF4126 domain-containing protein [Ktedonobacteraceae bacterium]
MNNSGTSYGLALASGVNAYLPLLSFAISARFFHLFSINPEFTFITQNGFMIALAILALIDIIADKIPVVDTLWDSIHTVLRPIAGALVVAACSNGASSVELPVESVLGAALAAMSHITKAVTRLTASVSTMGCLNIGLSLGEDVAVFIIILLAIFAPIVMLVFSIVFAVLFILFAPLLFSALSYRLRITFSILSWFIHSYFWQGSEPGPADFLLGLSDNDRAYLRQLSEGDTVLSGGVRLLWLRKSSGKGLWSSRRSAPSTWFVATDSAIILLPVSRPNLAQVIPFSEVQTLAFDPGLLMGTLRLLTRQGQTYNFTVLRASLDGAAELVEVLHMRHRLPFDTNASTGTRQGRTIRPQHI